MSQHVPFDEWLEQKRQEAIDLSFTDTTEDEFAEGAMVNFALGGVA